MRRQFPDIQSMGIKENQGWILTFILPYQFVQLLIINNGEKMLKKFWTEYN